MSWTHRTWSSQSIIITNSWQHSLSPSQIQHNFPFFERLSIAVISCISVVFVGHARLIIHHRFVGPFSPFILFLFSPLCAIAIWQWTPTLLPFHLLLLHQFLDCTLSAVDGAVCAHSQHPKHPQIITMPRSAYTAFVPSSSSSSISEQRC